jgi:hypothetical protein
VDNKNKDFDVKDRQIRSLLNQSILKYPRLSGTLKNLSKVLFGVMLIGIQEMEFLQVEAQLQLIYIYIKNRHFV